MTAFLNSCKGLIRSFVGTVPIAEMEIDGPKKTGLFAQCSFVVVRGAKLNDNEAGKVSFVNLIVLLLTILVGRVSETS
jgi:hypothetical protein